MSADGDQQERAIEHDLEMALHQANAKQSQHPQRPGEQARLLETVLESELDTDDEGLSNLSARDFPLSNYEEEIDTVEFKFLQEIVDILSKARFPHPRSGLTGLSRAWAAGDAGDRLQPRELDEFAKDESYKMGTYSRAMRGERGFQQETSAKQVHESHAIHDNSGGSKKGGFRGRWRRWRS